MDLAQARSQARNLALARELRRLLMLLKGESWRDTYEDLVIDHSQLPGADELEWLDALGPTNGELAEWLDAYGVNEDQLEIFT